MDLLGDLGASDQLTSAREENKVLQKKVNELKLKVRELTIENEALKAEVKEYRKEALSLSTGLNALSMKDGTPMDTSMEDEEAFIKSGDNVFPTQCIASLKNLHGVSNPLCAVLHWNDCLLGSGGADGELVLTQWGIATAPHEGAADQAVQQALRVRFNAPVLKIKFASKDSGLNVIAAGCMDGSVNLVQYSNKEARILEISNSCNSSAGPGSHSGPLVVKHNKYVKDLVWSPNEPLLASACAEGKVHVSRISAPDESGVVTVERIQTLYLPGAVEALCFLDDTLCCYVRDTSYISYFDMKNNWSQTKYSVNGVHQHDDFVSFAILSLVPSPDGKYLGAATDTSRNIIFEAKSSKIVRDLYGHKNDGFSTPKIAWSKSSMYLFGNTQDDPCICVWDIAGSTIVKKLEGEHSGQIRDIFSSNDSDTLVTVSYDKTVKFWSNEY